MKAIGFLVSVILISGLIAPPVFACSAFLVKKNNHGLVVKSYDWTLSHGMLIANQRDVEKSAHQPWPWQTPAQWTSKYGSLTFNQYGREFPVSGMNEKGLIIEVLWLEEATFPWWKRGPSVNELQFVQYMLDNAETVEEVIAQSKTIHISPVMFAPVHYFICDRSLDCALFQPIDRKFKIYHGDNFPKKLITNATYPDSLKGAGKFKHFGGSVQSIPENDYDDIHRFARIAHQIDKIPADSNEVNITSSIETILESVRGGTPDTEYEAVWNIIYDPKNFQIKYRKRYSVKDNKSADFKFVDLRKMDFSCGPPVLSKVMSELGSGDVTNKLSKYSNDINKEMIRKSITDYSDLPLIPEMVIKSANNYVSTHTQCATKNQKVGSVSR